MDTMETIATLIATPIIGYMIGYYGTELVMEIKELMSKGK